MGCGEMEIEKCRTERGVPNSEFIQKTFHRVFKKAKWVLPSYVCLLVCGFPFTCGLHVTLTQVGIYFSSPPEIKLQQLPSQTSCRYWETLVWHTEDKWKQIRLKSKQNFFKRATWGLLMKRKQALYVPITRVYTSQFHRILPKMRSIMFCILSS